MLKLPRRKFLHLAAGAAALPAVSRIARAQTYPSRPINVILPVPAGGLTDLIARIFGEHMRASLGQPVIVESVPGAGGSLAIARAVRCCTRTSGRRPMATTLIGNPPESRNATRGSASSSRARSGSTLHFGPLDDADRGADVFASWAAAGRCEIPAAAAINAKTTTVRSRFFQNPV